MPNIRKRAHTQQVLGLPELLHLTKGYCLVGGGCSLCTDMGQNARCRWVLNLKRARTAWTTQRAAILGQFYARCEQRGEPGACGVPLFGEVLFDNVPLPAPDPAWPEVVRKRYDTISTNLALHAEHFRIYGPLAG